MKNVDFWPLHKNKRKLCVVFQKRVRQLLFSHRELSHLKHITCQEPMPWLLNMYRSIPPLDVVMQTAQTALLLKEEVAMWFKNLHGIENSAILLTLTRILNVKVMLNIQGTVLESGMAYRMNFIRCLMRNLNATFTICSIRNSQRQMNLLIYSWKLNLLYLHYPSSFSRNLFNSPMNFVFPDVTLVNTQFLLSFYCISFPCFFFFTSFIYQ